MGLTKVFLTCHYVLSDYRSLLTDVIQELDARTWKTSLLFNSSSVKIAVDCQGIGWLLPEVRNVLYSTVYIVDRSCSAVLVRACSVSQRSDKSHSITFGRQLVHSMAETNHSAVNKAGVCRLSASANDTRAIPLSSTGYHGAQLRTSALPSLRIINVGVDTAWYRSVSVRLERRIPVIYPPACVPAGQSIFQGRKSILSFHRRTSFGRHEDVYACNACIDVPTSQHPR